MGIHTALDFICGECHADSIGGERLCGECSKDLCHNCEAWTTLPYDVSVSRDKEAEDYIDERDKVKFLEKHREGNNVLLCNDCWDRVLMSCGTCHKSAYHYGIQIDRDLCNKCYKLHCNDCIFKNHCWKCACDPDSFVLKTLKNHFKVQTPRELLQHLTKLAEDIQ